MGLERAELLRPKRLHLVEPGMERNERLGAKPVQAKPRVVLDRLHVDQAAGPEDAQVPAHRGAAHVCPHGQFPGQTGTLAKRVDDLPTSGVGQGGQRRVEIIHLSINY